MCKSTTQQFHYSVYIRTPLPCAQGGCPFNIVTYYEKNVNREIPTNK